MAQAIRVVLVEDNDLFREGDRAQEVCARLAPDVVLMDYRMPGLDGVEATAAVLEAAPASRVVCLTASVSREETKRLVAAGAVASLTKDAELEEILAAIRDAAARAPRA